MRVTQLAVIFVSGLAAVFLTLSPAAADKRVALVIGNGAYQKVAKLTNPTNDAKAIARLLQSAGFDAVKLHENLGVRDLRQAIKEFADLVRDADTAIVYYSGHGMEINGTNYLIPIDAMLEQDIDASYEAYSLDNLVQVLEPARRLRLVMLDACRDNPFMRSMKRTVGTRAVSRGLVAVEPASVNTLIGYAAKAGSTALDGDGANSPYTAALLHNLAIPGLDLRIAFGRVRDEVLKTTRNTQEPFVYGSLGGASVSIVDAPQNPAGAPQQTSAAPVDRAAQAWSVIQNTTSIAVLEDFIRQFADTPYASMARARVSELKTSQPQATTPTSANGPVTSAIDAAQAWSTIKDTTDAAAVENFIRQFGSTRYGSMARAKLAQLKKTKLAAAAPSAAPAAGAGGRDVGSSGCGRIVGTWSWPLGHKAVFNQDGSVRGTAADAKWTCDAGQVVAHWTNGATDHISISDDGNSLAVKNTWGMSFNAQRQR